MFSSRRGRTRSVRAPLSFVDPCLPTLVPRPPSGPEWLHEIKHDGFRGRLTARYPWIVEAARGLKAVSAVLDADTLALQLKLDELISRRMVPKTHSPLSKTKAMRRFWSKKMKFADGQKVRIDCQGYRKPSWGKIG